MVTVGFIGEEKKVRVSYATALDVYIILCFAFVFMALVEFAFIHFVEMYVRRVRFKVIIITKIMFFISRADQDKERALHLEQMTRSMIVPVINNVRIEAGPTGLDSRRIIINERNYAEGDFPSEPQERTDRPYTACPLHSTDTLTSSLPDIQDFEEQELRSEYDYYEELDNFCPVHSGRYQVGQ